MLQLTYELRPKWKNNKNNKNKNKTQNAVSRSDPLQGSDNDYHTETHREKMIIILITILMTIMEAMMTEFLNHSGDCAFTRPKISYLQIFLLGMVYDKQFTTNNK